jgi:hypothetical protein
MPLLVGGDSPPPDSILNEQQMGSQFHESRPERNPGRGAMQAQNKAQPAVLRRSSPHATIACSVAPGGSGGGGGG